MSLRNEIKKKRKRGKREERDRGRKKKNGKEERGKNLRPYILNTTKQHKKYTFTHEDKVIFTIFITYS